MTTGLKKGESCKQKFKELRILMYMLEVLCYMKKYKGSISENSEIHDHNTRRKVLAFLIEILFVPLPLFESWAS